VLDGFLGAQFLGDLKEALESPEEYLKTDSID
jgi:hypothetical protein